MDDVMFVVGLVLLVVAAFAAVRGCEKLNRTSSKTGRV
jgi:hypothetical protein